MIQRNSAFFIVELSHSNMTTGKTVALTRWTFVGKVISLLFNMLSKLVISFLPRSKCLLISWLQSPSAVIAVLISEKIDFKTNSAVGDKDRHYIMIMESIQHENITFVDICASNIGEHKCIKQI